MSPQHCSSSANSVATTGGRVEALGLSRHLLQLARAAAKCSMAHSDQQSM